MDAVQLIILVFTLVSVLLAWHALAINLHDRSLRERPYISAREVDISVSDFFNPRRAELFFLNVGHGPALEVDITCDSHFSTKSGESYEYKLHKKYTVLPENDGIDAYDVFEWFDTAIKALPLPSHECEIIDDARVWQFKAQHTFSLTYRDRGTFSYTQDLVVNAVVEVRRDLYKPDMPLSSMNGTRWKIEEVTLGQQYQHDPKKTRTRQL